jgi:hypothetical protein
MRQAVLAWARQAVACNSLSIRTHARTPPPPTHTHTTFC